MPTWSPRRIVVTALYLGAVACAPVAFLIAAPGAPAPAGASWDEHFRAVGDGSLPEDRPALRDPGAPVSSEERGYAIRLALETLPGTARDVLDKQGAEVLAADLPADADSSGRLVQVSLYDYDTDRLHQVVVDLRSGKATASHAVSGLQLPPSAAETQTALGLALAAWPALPFTRQFQTLTGAPLVAADQVQAEAGAWLPGGAIGDAARTDATGCGPDRCLQLLISVPSGEFLDTSDFVVDLSTRTVVDVGTGAPHGEGASDAR